MSGIVPTVSTSSFKPLDLNEIMMVPLAKQKMEDEFLAGSAKIDELQASTLASDSAEAKEILNSIKSKSSNLAQEVIDSGVSRSQFNKLRKLRSNTQKEFSSGFLSSAIANKKSAGEYMRRMLTNKASQAGYSPAKAKMWAEKQISSFKTRGDDGSISSFSPKELGERVDEDKKLKEVAESVKGKISKKAFMPLQKGNIVAFHDLLRTQEITRKDYNTVMEAMLASSYSDANLKTHLMQEAFFNNEQNPLDFGKMGWVEDRDAKGNVKRNSDGSAKKVRTYIPGKSRYALKMEGAGRAASSATVKYSDKWFKDEVSLKAVTENGANADKINRNILIREGEIMKMQVSSLSDIKESYAEYDDHLKSYKEDVDKMSNSTEADHGFKMQSDKGYAEKYKKYLEDNNIEEEFKEDSSGNKVVNLHGFNMSTDKKYREMYNNYSSVKIDHDNAKNFIENQEKEAFNKLSSEDKNYVNIQSMVDDHGGSILDTINSMYNMQQTPESLTSDYGAYAEKLMKENPEEYKELYEKEALKILAGNMNISKKVNADDIRIRMDRASRRRDESMQESFDTHRKGVKYTKVITPEESKYGSSEYSDYNTLFTNNMVASNVVIATEDGSEKTLSDIIQSKEFQQTFGSYEKDGGYPGLEFKKTFTIDGMNGGAQKFSELHIRHKNNKDASFVTQIADTAEDQKKSTELFENMMQSTDFKRRNEGEQGIAVLNHMPSLKRSLMTQIDSGKLKINLGGGFSSYDATFEKVKENGETRFKVYLFGNKQGSNEKPIDFNGNELLKSELEVAVALKRAVDVFNAERMKRQQEKNNQ